MLPRLLTILAVLAMPYLGHSNFLDSLENVFKNTSGIEEKIELAIKISGNYLSVDEEKALFYANESIRLAAQVNDPILKAEANESIAGFHSSVGNFRASAKVYIQALLIYESEKLYKNAAATSNNIANVYLALDDIAKADEYYTKSYQYGLSAQDTNAIAVPLIGLGILYHEAGENQKALDYVLEAIPLFEGIQRLDAQIVCYVNAATYYYHLGEKNEAYFWNDKAKKLNEILNNKYFSGSILLNESKWLAEEGKFSEARIVGEEGLEHLKEVNDYHNLMESYENLATVYDMSGDYKNAYRYLRNFVQLKDSLDGINRMEVMQELNAKYDNIKNEQKIAELSHINELQELENGKNEVIIYMALSGVLVLLILVTMTFIAYKQKKKSAYTQKQNGIIIREKNREILDSIAYAKRIQDAIIPDRAVLEKGLKEFFVMYEPKDIVAGDFYWMLEKDDKTLLAVADCTGHGVPGAMVSVICNNALNRAVNEFGYSKPSDILNKTKKLVVDTLGRNNQEIKDGMDISLISIERKNEEVTINYSGANSPLWVMREGQDEISEYKATKQPIGRFIHSTPFENHEIKLNQGDQLYLFTDGYADQFGGEKGKKFKTSNMKSLFENITKLGMPEQLEQLKKTYLNWKGDVEQIDDICVIGLKL